MYLVTPPFWFKWLHPKLVWNIPVEQDEKILYLTFDDGPHPIATPFVLDELKKYNAKATFFCIGRNVEDHLAIYHRVLAEGHSVGNHTYDHLNGWKVKDKDYIDNIKQASAVINSDLFRPPYGRITKFQSAVLRRKPSAESATFNTQHRAFKIIMWSVLAGDWDNTISREKCYENVVLHAKPGSIVVFHDSAKALERLQFALPKVLEYYAGQGYRFEAVNSSVVN